MLHPALSMTYQEIEQRLAMLPQVTFAVYDVHGDLHDTYDINNAHHRTMLSLVNEYKQRRANINHHLGWARKFDEPAHGNNTIDAAVALIQVEALASEILAISGTVVPIV